MFFKKKNCKFLKSNQERDTAIGENINFKKIMLHQYRALLTIGGLQTFAYLKENIHFAS